MPIRANNGEADKESSVSASESVLKTVYEMDGTGSPDMAVELCDIAAGYVPIIPGVFDEPVLEIGRGSITIKNSQPLTVEVLYYQDMSGAPAINGEIVSNQFLRSVTPEWQVPNAGFYLMVAKVGAEDVVITGHQDRGSVIGRITLSVGVPEDLPQDELVSTGGERRYASVVQVVMRPEQVMHAVRKLEAREESVTVGRIGRVLGASKKVIQGVVDSLVEQHKLRVLDEEV